MYLKWSTVTLFSPVEEPLKQMYCSDTTRRRFVIRLNPVSRLIGCVAQALDICD